MHFIQNRSKWTIGRPTKKTWWGEIDPWLTDLIYLHPKFMDFFNVHSDKSISGLYPIVTV